MFQRLKGFNLDNFLDGKIAEEQAKQGKQPSSSTGGPASSGAARRTAGSAAPRRGSSRASASGARPTSRARPQDDGDASTLPVKGPDPDDFAIGDDVSDISRAATPVPPKDGAEERTTEQAETAPDAATLKPEGAAAREKIEPKSQDDLPEDVKRKLAKLDTITARYQDLLRNYRTAHARVTAIEPFEATLREHTPLTSISDPGALVEFLNQRALQSDMVMEELKRITSEHREIVKERDELKVKLEDAERRAKETQAGIEEAKVAKQVNASDNVAEAQKEQSDPLGANASNGHGIAPRSSSTAHAEPDDETFFSYETELPRLEAEVKQHQDEIEDQKQYIDELSTENATLHRGLDTCKLDLSAAENKIAIKQREIESLQAQLTEAQRPGSSSNAQAKEQDREKRMKEIQQNIITQLKDEVQEAKDGKRMAEGRATDLHFEIKKLESEANASGEIITRLRGREAQAEAMRKQLAEAERERDEARRQVESKKGHEAAVASLRSQLKRTEHDRDAAYQMIIDCGKCVIPETKAGEGAEAPLETSGAASSASRKGSGETEQTETSTLPTESTTSESLTPAAAEGKKNKKKKKSKGKKHDTLESETASVAGSSSNEAKTTEIKTEQLSIEELIADPEKAEQVLRQADNETRNRLLTEFLHSSVKRVAASRDQENEEEGSLLRHHEKVIEEREQTIRDKDAKIEALEEVMHTKEIVVDESMRRLREKEGEWESLREAHADLQDSLTELGTEATDAKYNLRQTEAVRERLQEELDALQSEHDTQSKALKQAKTECDELRKLNGELTEQVESQTAKGSADAATLEQLHAAEQKLAAAEAAAAELQAAKEQHERKIAELEAQQSTSTRSSDERHASLTSALEASQGRQAELEKDLAAANSLAQTRFRDLASLREHLNSVQPELKRLRDEDGESKKAQAALEQSTASVSRLEAKEKELRVEIVELKSKLMDKDKDSNALREKLKRSEERSSALEDTCEKSRRDLELSDRTRDEAVDARVRLQTELTRANEELRAGQNSLEEAERKASKLLADATAARNELAAKTNQIITAQSAASSMQDQARELAAQMREARERSDGLEEEVADARRLLAERGREGDTMRRLLADNEARADARLREMRDRLELAMEERERAEADASSAARRRARETDEMKTQLRDAERQLQRAGEVKSEGERRERESASRADDLRRSASQAQTEATEVRSALGRLRDELAAGESERTELRRALDERDSRLEKLQTASKAMADELRTLQAAAASARAQRSSAVNSASARSSLDSSRAAGGLSPALSSVRPTSSSNSTVNGGSAALSPADAVYLKNVLLQFVEQRDRKHRMQLVPVLAMLLHFDKQDEQKWMAAISAR